MRGSGTPGKLLYAGDSRTPVLLTPPSQPTALDKGVTFVDGSDAFPISIPLAINANLKAVAKDHSAEA